MKQGQSVRRDPKGYYRIFAVTPDATMREITRAFRRQAQKLHPDKNSDPDSTRLFQYINGIYEILRNPHSRGRYDRGWRDNSGQVLQRRSA